MTPSDRDVPATARSGPDAAEDPAARPARPGRRALLVVGAAAALLAGADVVRRRLAAADTGVDGVVIHAAPRALPALAFVDGNGAPTGLAAFRGRAVVLNLWATWCPPCRAEMPTLDRLQDALGGPDFEVVALSIDAGGLPAVQAFYAATGIRHLRPYLDREQQTAALTAAGVPLTLLVDRDGREVGRRLGPATWDDPEMVALLRRELRVDARRAASSN